jgi:putative phage-type endonuclease
MRKLINVKELSHEQWLDMRKKSIGGSDSGACIGMNPWKSALELYADKKGLIPDKETTESMRLGTDLEEYVAQRFEEATGKKVRKNNFMYMHDKYDFITANIDREVVGEPAGLECKTMTPFTKHDVAAGEVPEQYYCQCQHYMAVMGYEYMYLAILVYTKGFYWFRVERNQFFIEDMINEEVYFWTQHIENNQPPAPDGSDSAADTFTKLHPQDNGLEIWLSNDSDIERYQEVSKTIKNLEKTKEELRTRICAELGDNSAGSTDKYQVTWKTQSRTSLDTKALKEKYPNIYAEFETRTQSRIMRVKEIK